MSPFTSWRSVYGGLQKVETATMHLLWFLFVFLAHVGPSNVDTERSLVPGYLVTLMSEFFIGTDKKHGCVNTLRFWGFVSFVA